MGGYVRTGMHSGRDFTDQKGYIIAEHELDRVAQRGALVSCSVRSRYISHNSFSVIDDAEAQGLLHPHTGSRIFEGTVGSTGISIATIARARYALSNDCEIGLVAELSP